MRQALARYAAMHGVFQNLALRCAGRTFVAPLVEEMLARIGSEVGRYERVVTYWPVFGPLLEGAVCAALREATGAVSRQCGLAQVCRPPGRGVSVVCRIVFRAAAGLMDGHGVASNKARRGRAIAMQNMSKIML